MEKSLSDQKAKEGTQGLPSPPCVGTLYARGRSPRFREPPSPHQVRGCADNTAFALSVCGAVVLDVPEDLSFLSCFLDAMRQEAPEACPHGDSSRPQLSAPLSSGAWQNMVTSPTSHGQRCGMWFCRCHGLFSRPLCQLPVPLLPKWPSQGACRALQLTASQQRVGLRRLCWGKPRPARNTRSLCVLHSVLQTLKPGNQMCFPDEAQEHCFASDSQDTNCIYTEKSSLLTH